MPLRPVQPPSLRRTRLWLVAAAVGPCVILTPAAASIAGGSLRWMVVGAAAVLLSLTVLVVLLAVRADRLRRRFRDEPFDRCPRCEHPLPTAPGAADEQEATCTECGLTQAMAEHRRPWAYFTGKRARAGPPNPLP